MWAHQMHCCHRISHPPYIWSAGHSSLEKAVPQIFCPRIMVLHKQPCPSIVCPLPEQSLVGYYVPFSISICLPMQTFQIRVPLGYVGATKTSSHIDNNSKKLWSTSFYYELYNISVQSDIYLAHFWTYWFESLTRSNCKPLVPGYEH